VGPAGITLVAVSKTFPVEAAREAVMAGVADLGESYVQEAVDKIDSMDLPARWHFIGHLQSNKVRPVVKRFSLIQSVDSLELLQRIDRIAAEEGKVMDVLLQVNVAGEEGKFGMPPPEAHRVLSEASALNNVRVKGLMLIPPFYNDPEMNRENFAALGRLSVELDSRGYGNWESRYLSMGMTDDFETAILQGANMIRVGQAVFGFRRRN
jgi:pyridoxal phosphate enzyme (YggS family)